jgi:hypothetical protein
MDKDMRNLAVLVILAVLANEAASLLHRLRTSIRDF